MPSRSHLASAAASFNNAIIYHRNSFLKKKKRRRCPAAPPLRTRSHAQRHRRRRRFIRAFQRVLLLLLPSSRSHPRRLIAAPLHSSPRSARLCAPAASAAIAHARALSDCKLQPLPPPHAERGSDLRSARSDRDYLLFTGGEASGQCLIQDIYENVFIQKNCRGYTSQSKIIGKRLSENAPAGKRNYDVRLGFPYLMILLVSVC